MKKSKNNIYWWALLFTCLFTLPLFVSNNLQIGHDTFFHLSRIEGYANALQHHQLLPAIYPDKNFGFGYASPLFYNDLLLLPVALLYTMHVPLSTCYKLSIVIATYASCLTMYSLCKKDNKEGIALLSTFLYICMPYRITNVYVRGALGEVYAMIFFPMLLEGLITILYKQEKSYKKYTLALCGLMFSHNLSFLLGVILTILLVCCNLKKMHKQTWIPLIKGTMFAFFITMYYWAPLLQQLRHGSFLMDYYQNVNPLPSNCLTYTSLYQFHTIYGYGPNSTYGTMVLNTGYILLISLIVFGCIPKTKQQKDIYWLAVIVTILPYLPFIFYGLPFLSILQFPWRLLLLSGLLQAYLCNQLLQNTTKKTYYSIFMIACCFAFLQLKPTTKEPFINKSLHINTTTTYNDIIEGRIIDPCFSAYFKRVELAAGEYLPSDSKDFRKIPHNTYTLPSMEYIANTSFYNCIEVFKQDQTPTTIVFPKSYYYGYKLIDSNHKKIPIIKKDGLVTAVLTTPSTYTLRYKNTGLRNISICISLCALAYFIITLKKEIQNSR